MIGQSNGQMTKPDSVQLLPDRPRIKGLHTIIRLKLSSSLFFTFSSLEITRQVVMILCSFLIVFHVL